MTLVWIGRWRLLIARPDVAWFGTHVLGVLRALHVARGLDAHLLLLASPRDPNTAFTHLQSDDCKIIYRPRLSQLLGRAASFWERQQCNVLALAQVARGPRMYRAWLTRLRHARNEIAIQCATRRHRPLDPLWGLAARMHELWIHHPIRVRLSSPVEQDMTRAARSIGIPVDRPFVCFNVREGDWQVSEKANVGYSVNTGDTARNAAITPYLPAIAYLVSEGFAVVRIGGPTQTPLDYPGVIDLANSSARSDLLELWCALHAAMLLVTASGPHAYGQLTQTPTLCTNAPVKCPTYMPYDRTIVKLAIDHDAQRVLSIEEMLTSDYRHWSHLDRFELIDNDPDDILAATQEMVSNMRHTPELVPEQLAYRQALLIPGTLPGELTPKERLKAARKAARAQKRRLFSPNYIGDGHLGQAFARRYYKASRTPGIEPTRNSTGHTENEPPVE